MSTALMHLATPLAYLLGLLVVGALLFLVSSFLFGRGEHLAPMPPDVSPVVLPSARRVSGRDLRRVRISVVLRGYRMSEVDWILDQVADQLDERDRELDRLRARLGESDAAGPDSDPTLDEPGPVSDPAVAPEPERGAAGAPVPGPARDDRRD